MTEDTIYVAIEVIEYIRNSKTESTHISEFKNYENEYVATRDLIKFLEDNDFIETDKNPEVYFLTPETYDLVDAGVLDIVVWDYINYDKKEDEVKSLVFIANKIIEFIKNSETESVHINELENLIEVPVDFKFFIDFLDDGEFIEKVQEENDVYKLTKETYELIQKGELKEALEICIEYIDVYDEVKREASKPRNRNFELLILLYIPFFLIIEHCKDVQKNQYDIPLLDLKTKLTKKTNG